MRKRLTVFILALAASAFLLVPALTFAQANPCAAQTDKKAEKGTKEKAAKSKEGAQNPCSAKNPCAANPCAAKK